MTYHIGCSGFMYKTWRGNFYPKRAVMFDYYFSKLDSLEVNGSFYNFPTISTFKKWHDRSPSHATFVIKAPRVITHLKKLNQVDIHIAMMSNNCVYLKDKLACILWQLPPNFSTNMLPRLELFCKSIHSIFPDSAFEFRHCSWLDNKDVLQLLDAYSFHFVVTDYSKYNSFNTIVNPYRRKYIRLHGPEGNYTGCYKQSRLSSISAMMTPGSFAFFNNDADGYAPFDAIRLKELLS